jgi:hypothetical protein
VTVPPKWYVEQELSGAYLWNSATGESAWFQAQRPQAANFQFWSDPTDRLAPPHVQVLARRQMQVAGGTITCLEKDFEPTTGLHLPSVDCRSTLGVEVTFFGGIRPSPRQDYSEFYSLLDTIRPI